MVESDAELQSISIVAQSISDPDKPLSEKIRSALDITANKLGFPIAYFTDIDDQTQRIVAAVGDHEKIREGTVDQLEKLLSQNC